MKLFQLLAVTVCVTCFTDGALAQTASAPPMPVKRTQVKAQSAQAHPKDPEKFDTSLPVEISSDSLEVLQKENKAIFKGNVVAVQGQVRLKSDVMIVHYKQQGGDKQNAASAAPASAPVPAPQPDDKAAPGEMGAVTLIEVQGNVLMATPEESAKGDEGDYEVAARTLHLFGNNVVLTRDKNIMRGTALTYNMETGRSILTDHGNTVNGKSSTGGRVHSVFVPNQEPAPAAKTGNTKQGNTTQPLATGGR